MVYLGFEGWERRSFDCSNAEGYVWHLDRLLESESHMPRGLVRGTHLELQATEGSS